MRSTIDVNRAAESYYFSAQQTGIDNRCRERMIKRCLPYIKPGKVLELGFMDGQWTDHFLKAGCRVTIVEGADRNLAFGRNKYAGISSVSFVHSLFEQYKAAETYDLVHMGGMLKHLENPTAFLRETTAWLKPDGLLIATTPNARSLHRRVGVHMGLLADLSSLSETDQKVGNLRHYDLDSFRRLLVSGGYRPIEIATSVVKPVSSNRMNDWPDDLLDALDKIATEIPDYGWYIYAICKLPLE